MYSSFEDQLRWKCFVDKGIILQDSSNVVLQQSFWVHGYDYESEHPDTVNEVSKYLNFVFAAIGSGWVLSVNNIILDDKNYLEMRKNHFYHPLFEKLDKEREYFFKRKEAKFFINLVGLTLTFAPQQITLKKLGKAFQSSNKESNKISNLDNYLEEFKSTVQLYAKLISKAMKLTPMTNNKTLSYLYYLVSHKWVNFKIPDYVYIKIKTLLVENMVCGLEPIVGDKHLRVVVIDNYFPEWVDTLALERLRTLGFSFRWNTKYYFYAKYEAQQQMLKQVQMHEFNSTKLKLSHESETKVNRGAIYLSDDAQEALAQTYRKSDNYGRYSCQIILMHEDEQEVIRQANEVARTFMEMDYKARIEKDNAIDCYFSSLDGDLENNKRRSLISTHNVADLLPLSGFWGGLNHHPSPLYPEESNPMFIADCDSYNRFSGNIFDHDLGHGLLIGASGFGKSTMANFLISSFFRYKGSQVFVFDNKCSTAPLCFGANGSFYDLGNDKSAFQPLAEIDTPSGYDFAVDWVETLCELNNLTLTADLSLAIRQALKSLAESPVEFRTMDSFKHLIRAFSLELENVISLYSGNETMQGTIFNASNDNIALSNFTVFEMGELNNKGDKALIPAQKYINHKIMSRLDGRPTLIVVEEADSQWKHPALATMQDEWLKKLRKLNVAVWFVALQPESIVESPIKASLLNLCPTKIFTGNRQLKSEHIFNTYLQLGLTGSQIGVLKEAMPKKHYYITNSHGSRLFNLDLEYFEIAKAFFSRTSKTDTDKAKKLKKQYGDDFAQAWLKDSGIDYVQI